MLEHRFIQFGVFTLTSDQDIVTLWLSHFAKSAVKNFILDQTI